MYVHNIDPDLIKIGFITIRFYGIVYFLGYLFINWFVQKQAHKIKNFNKKKASDFTTYIILASILGGRIGHVLLELPFYIQNPISHTTIFGFTLPIPSFLAVWNGGMAFIGGLIGGILIAIWYCKKHKINFFSVADKTVFFLPLVLIFGRIANFINGEHPGYITNLPWAMKFPNFDGFRHPSPIYEAISMIILTGFMYFIYKKKYNPGAVFWAFIFGYSVLRFGTEFFRYNEVLFFGISVMQYVFIIAGVFSLYKFRGVK